MPDHKFDRSTDRQLVLLDFKQRLIDLMENKQPLPETDIYDEPVRYYKLNLKWAPIVFGWLDWLEDVAGWQAAQDDNFAGIQAILKFEEGIELPTVDCADVADCIENSEAVQDAIENYLNNSGNGNPDQFDPDAPIMDDRFPPDKRELPIKEPPEDCDNDILWSGILNIVTQLDANATDLLEKVLAEPDITAQFNMLLELFPSFGLLTAPAIIGFIEIADTLLTKFNAWSTTEHIQDAACRLFSLVCEECRYPSYDELYFEFQSGGVSGTGDLASLAFSLWVESLTGSNSETNEGVWNTLMAFTLYTAFLGTKTNKLPNKTIIPTWAALGETSPSHDWLDLCGPCGTNTKVWNFRISNQGWVAQGGRATYVPDTGWQKVTMPYGEVIVIEKGFTWPSDLVITQMRFYMDNRTSSSFKYFYGMNYANGTWTAFDFDPDGCQNSVPVDKGTRVGLGVEFSIFADIGQTIYRVEVDYTGTPSPDW